MERNISEVIEQVEIKENQILGKIEKRFKALNKHIPSTLQLVSKKKLQMTEKMLTVEKEIKTQAIARKNQARDIEE